MRKLHIANAQEIMMGLQDEIRRNRNSRYDHRLHAILLVAQGISCRETARLFGDGPRTVEYWVHRFEEDGLAGLIDEPKQGRPSRLNGTQYESLGEAIRKSPLDLGLPTNAWDGKTMAEYIRIAYGVELGARQCQRLFRQLGFRLRKPRPVIARADPERQEEHKKNSGD